MKQADVLQAIQGSGAVMSTIAKRLGVAWYTAKRYVNKWETTRQAFDDEEQKILDLAESAIYQSIQNGNTQDAKWLLSTKGKNRGFTERQEITGADGGPVNAVVTWRKPDTDDGD